MYSHIIGSLDKKELKNAFVSLYGMTSALKEYYYHERLNELQDTYIYMLRYCVEGAKDPMQEQIYHNLLASTYELADQVKHKALIRESSQAFYSRRRILDAGTPVSYPELHSQLQNAAGRSNNEWELVYETGLISLFHKIWVSDLLTKEESSTIREILTDDRLPCTAGCQIVSALFMGLQEAFDREKILLLFDAAESPKEETGVRALICILLALYTYKKRLYLYPQVKNRLAALAENPGFTSAVRLITLRFILSRETEKITRKLQEEILPEMMKLSPKIGKKINLKDFSAENMSDDMNPEWESIIGKNTELGKKMQEFGELQQEGADVMHSTFIHLKNFPFFREISNWFLPFMPEHSSLHTVPGEDKGGGRIPETLFAATFMCDSDKYSLYFSMLQLPERHRRAMLEQFDGQASEMIEQAKEELITKRGKTEIIAGQYIQDLYRFYKLHSSRKDFNDIFTRALDFHNLPILQPYISDRETLVTIAEYYLQKGYYPEALTIFLHLIEEGDKENDVFFQKAGYCRQMSGEIEEALRLYLRADLINADSKWVIRRIGGCYRSLKQPEKALPYYQRCEVLLPDDLSVQMSIGHCYLEMKEYSEALKYYYKVDYLDNKNNKAWRPIAWCSFLTGRYDQARNYYKKIMEANPVMQDYLNAGHTEWALQNVKVALTLYKNAAGMEAGDFRKFLEQFNQDVPDLLIAGIEEEEIPLMLDKLRYQLEA